MKAKAGEGKLKNQLRRRKREEHGGKGGVREQRVIWGGTREKEEMNEER